MKIVKLKNENKLSQGRYGMYFLFSKVKGIKLLGKGFKSVFDLTQNSIWHHAKIELSYNKLAQKSGISPKQTELVVAEYKNRFYPAIIMQHLSGKTLHEYNSWEKMKVAPNGKLTSSKSKENLSIENFIHKKLKKCNIFHGDLNKGNIILSPKGKVQVIDFSPDHITVKNKI